MYKLLGITVQYTYVFQVSVRPGYIYQYKLAINPGGCPRKQHNLYDVTTIGYQSCIILIMTKNAYNYLINASRPNALSRTIFSLTAFFSVEKHISLLCNQGIYLYAKSILLFLGIIIINSLEESFL